MGGVAVGKPLVCEAPGVVRGRDDGPGTGLVGGGEDRDFFRGFRMTWNMLSAGTSFLFLTCCCWYTSGAAAEGRANTRTGAAGAEAVVVVDVISAPTGVAAAAARSDKVSSNCVVVLACSTTLGAGAAWCNDATLVTDCNNPPATTELELTIEDHLSVPRKEILTGYDGGFTSQRLQREI